MKKFWGSIRITGSVLGSNNHRLLWKTILWKRVNVLSKFINDSGKSIVGIASNVIPAIFKYKNCFNLNVNIMVSVKRSMEKSKM